MKKLENDQLTAIDGGFGLWAGAAIVAFVIFAVGVFDGYTRPIKCNR